MVVHQYTGNGRVGMFIIHCDPLMLLQYGLHIVLSSTSVAGLNLYTCDWWSISAQEMGGLLFTVIPRE